MSSIVQAIVDPGMRFPQVPILAVGGRFSVCVFTDVIGGWFGPTLDSLVSTYGDDVAEFVAIEDQPGHYRELFSRDPEFQMRGPDFGAQLSAGLYFEPGTEVMWAFTIAADNFAMAGTSRSWAIWGQRDWEIALVWTSDADGPWLQGDVVFYDPFQDFEHVRGPVGAMVPLSEEVVAAFRRNLSIRLQA